MLKGHGPIDCPKEFEKDVLNVSFLFDVGLKLKIFFFYSESAEQGRHSVSNLPAFDKVSMIQNQIQQLSQQRYQHLSIIYSSNKYCFLFTRVNMHLTK